MINFFDLWKQALNRKPQLILEISYNKVTDWIITIHDSTKYGIQLAKEIISIQEATANRAFAVAYVKLTDWLLENCGGY